MLFAPCLPDVLHPEYNSFDSLTEITERTACVIAETVQGEAGIIVPSKIWMQALREKCTETGTLLILDEIQAGFGRTGKLWGFEHFDIVPDILLLGKALGGGMPLGAFIADRKLMDAFTENPVLGHITTFGGHPVCCAAGMAAMKALLEEGWMGGVKAKEELFRSLLKHPPEGGHHAKIKAVRSFGLWMAVEFDSFETNKKVIDACIAGGVLTDWFLFAPNCLRISPPLIISEEQIRMACIIILMAVVSRRFYSTSTTNSISTAIFIGNEHIPTADLACLPFSPNISTIRSENPLITLGWSLKSDSQFTIPSTFTMRLILFRSPSSALSTASWLIAVSLAACCPSASDRSLPTLPVI